MTSQAEKKIHGLSSLQETPPTKDVIVSVLESLLRLGSNHWTEKKMKDYW